MIRAVAAAGVPVVALDLPSGLEATGGRIGDPCIAADATLTLALPKTGLAVGVQQVGELYVADISVPPWAHAALGITIVPPLREVGIRRVTIAEPADVDGARLLDEHPGQVAVHLDLRSERRGPGCRRGRGDQDRREPVESRMSASDCTMTA